MCEWEKLLLSENPALETLMDMSPFTSQATLQNNPPTHPTSHPPPSYPTSQNQLSSIQMPPKNTHFPNHLYPSHHHAPIPQHLTPHP